MLPRSLLAIAALACVAGLVAGCGGGGGADSGTASGAGAGGTASATRTATPLPTREVPRVVAQRCLVDVPGEVVDLTTGDGSRFGAAVYGSGGTAVVLLHQTGAAGLCGWVTYARWLEGQGVLALAVDDCVHGSSRCTEAAKADPAVMVRTAVEAARARGATRVGVVGASMGGARALGVGQAAGADVVVDLSGPTRWDGVPDAVAAARATTVPLLVVSSDGDRGIPGDELAAAVSASPASPKRHWRLSGSDHGWEITMDGSGAEAAVTAEGRAVLEWVRHPGG